MLSMSLHAPQYPPHRTTQRWLPCEQTLLVALLLEQGVSLAPATMYGVPRRSMTPTPVRLRVHTQSDPEATV
eukprot:scaffold81251_cov63-Phaeocystis_antarctica.AAC.5